MKKTVILILAILPIFLVITIAFAGRIYSYYQYLPVEKVEFVNQNEQAYDPNFTLELEIGEQKETAVKIYPELATKKDVTYESSNEDICTVDENGKIHGVYYGSAQITVTTVDSQKTAVLKVFVNAKRVVGVTLPKTELTMTVGEMFKLEPEVQLVYAENKNVTFLSSDSHTLKITADGEMTALKEGVVEVTVVTVDGGFKATCTVTIVQGTPPIRFTLEEQAFISKLGDFLMSAQAEIDLNLYVAVDSTKVDASDVKFTLKDGSNRATLTENGIITLNKKGPVTVVAYVGSVLNPTYKSEIILTLPLN